MKRKDRQAGRNEKGHFLKGNKLSKISKEDFEHLVDEYCKHRAQGYEKKTFALCDYRTIMANATDLHLERIRVADAANLHIWERIAQNAAFGIETPINGGTSSIVPERINHHVMIFMMKNKFWRTFGDYDRVAAEKEEVEKEKNQSAGNDESSLWRVLDPASGSIEILDIGGADEE